MATSHGGQRGRHFQGLVRAHILHMISLVLVGLTRKEAVFQNRLVTPVPIGTRTGARHHRCGVPGPREIRQPRRADSPLASPCWLLACFTMPLSACWRGLGIIQHHQARGTDAMSDGTRLVDDGLYCGSWRKWPCRLAQKRLAQDDPHAHKRHAQHGHARLCLMAKRSGMWRRAGSAVLFNCGIADNS